MTSETQSQTEDTEPFNYLPAMLPVEDESSVVHQVIQQLTRRRGAIGFDER